jgi:ADP-ribose pyrophosphatase YjhB (NUDIX family)
LNEPAKGKWFVPGGVIRKYERLADAFARIVKAEIGLDASIDDAKFVGVYEHLYDDNVFGEEEFGTHYVVLAHQLNLDHQPPIMSDRQHSGFRWMTPAELISSPDAFVFFNAACRGRAPAAPRSPRSERWAFCLASGSSAERLARPASSKRSPTTNCSRRCASASVR